MKTMDVHSKTHTYPIYIGFHLRKKMNELIKHPYSKIFIITDENVASLYLQDILDGLKDKQVIYEILQQGECSKTIETYYKLQTKALIRELDRNSLIIALGGGMVGDIAGFVAATFMRGIDYIQMPTTILAHDSSIGGKVAINHERGKNLIGSFYAPKAVIYDIDMLKSLPQAEIRSGYAEIVKEALLANNELFIRIMQTNLENLSTEQLITHIYDAIQIKKDIIELDEFETSVRKHLNLGHTLGHALEAYFNYDRILHGEAVAIGLLFSLFISERYFQNKMPLRELYNWLLKNDYPLYFSQIDLVKLLQWMKLDKKRTNDTINFVLLRSIEQPKVVSFSEEEILNDMKQFFAYLDGGNL